MKDSKYFPMRNLIIAVILLLTTSANAQFGIGLTASTDIYQRYSNPKDDVSYRSAGSTLLNLGLGPKIWLGGEKFSVSFEGQATVGLLGLSLGDYKGLGMASFPIMMKFNFGGLSTLDKEGKTGFSIGGGIQYSKTEMFYLNEAAKDAGITRDFFKTYVAQFSYGGGLSGFGIMGFLRLGYNPDNKANTLNFGIQYDFNFRGLKQITNPESDL
jgi:hypothetical protein